MDRVKVTWGAPRRTVVYPAVAADLSGLLGVDLSGAFAFAPGLELEHRIAGAFSAGAEIGGGPLVTDFNLAADIAAVSGLVADLGQGSNLRATLSGVAALDADAQQDHLVGLDVFALSRLNADVSSEVVLGATMDATVDLAGDVTAQAAGNPTEYATLTYTGNGAQRSITGAGFKPDFILFAPRGGNTSVHAFIGDRASLGPGFIWDATHDDPTWLHFTIDDPDSVISFDADGFTIGTSSRVNASSQSMLALCIKNGDQFEAIDKANDGVDGQVVSHNLSTAPVWAMVKQSDENTGAWLKPWGKGSEAADGFGAAKASETKGLQGATASDVTLGNSSLWNQGSGSAPLYLFGSENIAGSYHTGTYTGTGANGNAVTGLGFEPECVLIRSLDGAGVFLLAGSLSNGDVFRVDTSDRGPGFTLDADGFTVDDGAVNRSGEDYRYFAWV